MIALVPAFALGCDNAAAPQAPSVMAGPAAAVNLAPPVVTATSPNTGSTDGGAFPFINGTGFHGNGYQSGVSVTFDGLAIPVFFATDTSIFIRDGVPPHVSGPVDVVVTNSVGQEARLSGGFTYVSPESLDFNGRWRGEEGQPPFEFTIQGNALISLSCGSTPATTVAPPIPISHGGFTYSTDEGIVLSGRIVSPSLARGTIKLGSCVTELWFAGNE
jgi:hypothetical protein